MLWDFCAVAYYHCNFIAKLHSQVQQKTVVGDFCFNTLAELWHFGWRWILCIPKLLNDSINRFPLERYQTYARSDFTHFFRGVPHKSKHLIQKKFPHLGTSLKPKRVSCSCDRCCISSGCKMGLVLISWFTNSWNFSLVVA